DRVLHEGRGRRQLAAGDVQRQHPGGPEERDPGAAEEAAGRGEAGPRAGEPDGGGAAAGRRGAARLHLREVTVGGEVAGWLVPSVASVPSVPSLHHPTTQYNEEAQ